MNDDRISAAKRDLLTCARDLLAKLDDAKIETDRLLDLAETIQRAAADQGVADADFGGAMRRLDVAIGHGIAALVSGISEGDGTPTRSRLVGLAQARREGETDEEWNARLRLWGLDEPVTYGAEALEVLDGLEPVRQRPTEHIVLEDDGDQAARDRMLREAYVIERLDDLDDTALEQVAALVGELAGG